MQLNIQFFAWILFTIISVNTYSQTPVLSINDERYREINGAYYKDMDNDMDKFIGTWKYTNGATNLTISLVKKSMQLIYDQPFTYYQDYLVGEYKYIENGIEKINTLPQLSQNLTPYQYNITGAILTGASIINVYATFQDPERDILGMEAYMLFERADTVGLQKIKVTFNTSSGAIVEQGVIPPYTNYNIPFGEYVLIKQP